MNFQGARGQPDDQKAKDPLVNPGESQSRRTTIAAWLFGLLLLGALVTFVARRGEIAQFAELLRDLQPRWFVAALVLQVFSQLSSAAVWYSVFRFARHPPAFGADGGSWAVAPSPAEWAPDPCWSCVLGRESVW